MEARPHRITESLTDLNGYEVFIHGDTVAGLVAALSDVFVDALSEAPLKSEPPRAN
jgi:hypothetical protein